MSDFKLKCPKCNSEFYFNCWNKLGNGVCPNKECGFVGYESQFKKICWSVNK